MEEVYTIVFEEPTYNTVLQEEEITVSFEEGSIDVTFTEEVLDCPVVEEVIDSPLVEEVITVELACPVYVPSPGNCTGGAFIFATDVQAHGGIVGNKVWEQGTVPSDTVILEATSDGSQVEVFFLAEGGQDYSPVVTVDGIICTNLVQVPGDKRLFQGSVIIDAPTTGEKVVGIFSSTGATTSVVVKQAGPGPEIQQVTFLGYPGTQTALKSGDTAVLRVRHSINAKYLKVLGSGAFTSGNLVPASSSGITDIVAVAGTGNGTFKGSVVAVNDFGTYGSSVLTDEDIILDQYAPVITDLGTVYPQAQLALKGTEVATQKTEVQDFTSIVYSNPTGQLTIPASTVYTLEKDVQCTNPGVYNDDVVNFSVTAFKSSNGTQTTFGKVIEIADTPPVVVVTQPIERLRSSPGGEVYTITASCDQKLVSPPDIDIPVSGTWVDSGFTGGPKVFHRRIKIKDQDAVGIGAWTWGSGILPCNRAGLAAVGLQGNEVVGGFVARTITIPAWPTRQVPIGTAVLDVSKLVCENLSKGGTAPHGGTYYQYKSSTLDQENCFTIVNGSEWYNCDLNNAVSNTSGTAQVIIEETV